MAQLSHETSRSFLRPMELLFPRVTPQEELLGNFRRLPNIFYQYRVSFDNEYRIAQWASVMRNFLAEKGQREQFTASLPELSPPYEAARLFATLNIYGTGLRRGEWLADTVIGALVSYQDREKYGNRTTFGNDVMGYLRREEQVGDEGHGEVYTQVKNDMIERIERFYESLAANPSGSGLSHT